MPAPEPDRSTGEPGLLAGAVKVDITPSDLTGLNPIGGGSFREVHDPLHLRALVLSAGGETVAVVATDLIEVGDMTAVRARIERESGIPADHVLITASHTHSAPRLGRVSPGALAHDGGPESDAYSAWVYDRLIGAILQARERSVPARVGYGEGHVDVNVNRDEYLDGRWKLGVNPDGPSDKTIRVIKVEALDGAPIAVVLNYAVHSVVTLGSGAVSADIAGAAAREVERRLGQGSVALWTLGSVGDQNPRIQLGFPGERTEEEIRAAWSASDVLGLLLGAEAVRVSRAIEADDDEPRLVAEERVIPSPTKRGVDVMASMRQASVDLVDLRLILLRIGAIAVAGVSGEVTTSIAERLRAAAPLRATILVSMANDRIGYLPDAEAFDRGTFEANGSPIEKGHAAESIVKGLTAMSRSALR